MGDQKIVLRDTIYIRDEVENLAGKIRRRGGQIQDFDLKKIDRSESQLVIIMTIKESDSRFYPGEKNFSFRDSKTEIFRYYSPQCEARLEVERKVAAEEARRKEAERLVNIEKLERQRRYNEVKTVVLRRQKEKNETELDDEVQKELEKIKDREG